MAILKRQVPDEEKRQRADFVIDTVSMAYAQCSLLCQKHLQKHLQQVCFQFGSCKLTTQEVSCMLQSCTLEETQQQVATIIRKLQQA